MLDIAFDLCYSDGYLNKYLKKGIDMKGEWCFFKSYFSKDDCQKIISDTQSIPFQDGTVGVADGGQHVNDKYRRSKIKFLDHKDKKFSYLFDALWKTALQANDEFFRFNISRLNFVQFAEYDASYKGEYKPHHDVFWLNGDDFYHRKLSCSIQLSDPSSYEGGNLELLEVRQRPLEDDLKTQGTILFFPSFIPHLVKPVTKGTRYSLVAWFEGSKWS